jgi:hypothetical protein
MNSRRTLCLLGLLVLPGCGTMFDFSGPPDPVDPSSGKQIIVTNFAIARDVAGKYRDYYQTRADWVANGFQLFDLPIIGGAITGVAALAFHSNKAIPLTAGLVAGGATVLESFYDPRDRVQIYVLGYNAMVCIQREAAQAATTYLKDDAGNFKDSFGKIPDMIATANADS